MKLRLVTIALMLSLAGCSTIQSAGSSVSDTESGWLGSNAAKEAAKPAPLVSFKQTVVISEAWKASVGETGGRAFSPAVDADAVLVVSSANVLRLNLQNGTPIWKFDAGTRLTAGAGAGQGLVLAGCKGASLALTPVYRPINWSWLTGCEVQREQFALATSGQH